MAGEALPLISRSEEFYLINVLECIDALDHDRTEWELIGDPPRPVRITKYYFMDSMFPESSLFKIPQTGRGRVMSWLNCDDPSDSFYQTVLDHGLKGISFIERWRSE